MRPDTAVKVSAQRCSRRLIFSTTTFLQCQEYPDVIPSSTYLRICCPPDIDETNSGVSDFGNECIATILGQGKNKATRMKFGLPSNKKHLKPDEPRHLRNKPCHRPLTRTGWEWEYEMHFRSHCQWCLSWIPYLLREGARLQDVSEHIHERNFLAIWKKCLFFHSVSQLQIPGFQQSVESPLIGKCDATPGGDLMNEFKSSIHWVSENMLLVTPQSMNLSLVSLASDPGLTKDVIFNPSVDDDWGR